MTEPAAKRPNVPPLQPPVDVNSNVAYKFLVDSNEAGHLIGSKGATVDAMQNECGAKIRIASNGQFFPTTQRRTLMIQGIYSAVGRGIDILLNRIYEERLRNRRQNGGDVGMLQMEVIVANSCAGKVIGRGGENIGRLQQECNVQITVHKQNPGEYNQERRITITANESIEDTRKAMHSLLEWVQRDGNSLNFAMVRYGDDTEPSFQRGSSSSYDDFSYGNNRSSHAPEPTWSGSERRGSSAPAGPPARTSSAGRVQVRATLEAPIPDNLCWSLLRDNGRHLDSLSHETGAAISVQHSGEIEGGHLVRNSLAIIKGTLPTASAALYEVERLILENTQQQ